MRFLRHSPQAEAVPYELREPYGEARAELLARRPEPGHAGTPGPFGRLFSVVADVGLDHCLVSVYLVADGTISIYTSDGIHSTGLRGAPAVAATAPALFEEVEKTLGEFTPVEDIGTLQLPDRGDSQILARTYEGDLAAARRLNSRPELIVELATMALIISRLARGALIEGFDRLEAGEVCYQQSPEYRRIRSTLMAWIPEPEQLVVADRVASVTVEIGEEETESVTSLFALADGSISVYRSDGTRSRDLAGMPGAAEAARLLLGSVEGALAAFGPAELITLPQPGQVQFVARARSGRGADWPELVALARRATLASGSHPLSEAFNRATEVLTLLR